MVTIERVNRLTLAKQHCPTFFCPRLYFNVMVWGFCYLRIFKKLHSISGRSLSNICHFKTRRLISKYPHLSAFSFLSVLKNSMYSCGIKISGTIFLSFQQNLCKTPSTVIMTDIQKLNFSVSVTQSILNFQISVSCTECN
jgi:hypothetical protein